MASPEFTAWVERAKAVKIETILGERNIKLAGHHGKLAGPCPICGGNDRFAVHLGKQMFHCRQCGGEGGGSISFVRFLDGCDFLRAVEAITREPPPKDQTKASSSKRGAAQKNRRILKTYDYCDEIGNQLFQVVRYDPKGFGQRRPDPEFQGRWLWNLNSVRLVPYRLPSLIEAIACEQTIYLVEGEKDTDTGVESLGLAATTTPMGAGKWKGDQGDRYAEFFRGADVVIIPDNDEQGRAHANTVAGKLHEVAEQVRILLLPQEKDLTKWVEAGGTREQLDQLTEIAPEYMNGYDPGGADAASALAQATINKGRFLEGFVPPDYLVDGILQRRFIYALTGQTGHAKTAVALLIAELVSSSDLNSMLGKHRVGKGRVIYFVGENPDDVRMRIIGSDSVRQDDPSKDNISFAPGVFDIAAMFAALEEDCRANGEPSLIIVDTSAAYFLGDEELSNTQMGTYARTLRKLTKLPGGPCVLVLCHPIKHVQDPDQLLPRGGGAYLAEMDGNLTLWRKTDETVELHHTKIRGPGFQAMSFKLETLKCAKLIDKNGRAISTVRAVAITQKEEEQREDAVEQDEDRVLAAMLKVPATEGGSFATWATDIGWVAETGEPYKKKVERIVNQLSLKKPKLTIKNRSKWHLSEEGKEIARLAALRFLKTRDAAAQVAAQGKLI